MTNRDTTKLTLETEDGTYIVEISKIEMNIDEMMDLVVATLIAAGFSSACVARGMADRGEI